MFVPGI
ncbi:unnamed protein product [Clonostachys chloroleuca]|nr:unnamed protein product [Clonostachys chloroleuca]